MTNSEKVSMSYDKTYVIDPFQRVVLNGWPLDRYQALVYLINMKGNRVLDIGCGNGSTLAAIGENFDELHGIEFSSVRAENATRNLRAYNTKIINVNIEERTPYPDEYFDCIFWADVIEHTINLWGAMEEITRILKTGGTLITITPNIAKIKARIRLLLGRFPATSASNEGFQIRAGEMFDGGHMHYFTYSMMRKLYHKYNLTVVREIGIGKYGRLHNFWRTLLSAEVVTVGKKASNA